MYIIGISAFYHDSAACLIKDGKIIAAAQEERFTRKKHDSDFPKKAVDYCFSEAGISIEDIDYLVYYDKPFLTFERILETYLAYVPKGLKSYIKALPVWLKEKLWIPIIIEKKIGYKGKILFTEHHHAHAASAFFASPFEESAFLTLDGVGEWTTTSTGIGRGNQLKVLKEIYFPHSLGLLYSAFTYYTGFKVNSGEYKIMGLAPYGEPKYVDLIYEHLIDVKEDGSFRLNMEYFDYPAGLVMTNKNFDELFGGPARQPEAELTQKEMDLSRSIQVVTEEIVLKIVKNIHKETGLKNLCLAGGVALNCVANAKILNEGPFDNIWIQPASGDAGGALGAALAVWYQYLGKERKIENGKDFQQGSFLGPEFSDKAIEKYLNKIGAKYKKIQDLEDLFDKTSSLIIDGNVIGWFQGRMEYGPRALGNRSIIGDARSQEMQKIVNLKIKYRESFRPFAPSVLYEHSSDWFDIKEASPYMLLTAQVKENKQHKMTREEERLFGIEKLNISRSQVPAITHVDYSARLQTVHKETNPRYHGLINNFYKKTGCPVIINTSFNVRGEPIVCTPEDAYKCFMRTEMDYLVMNNYILDKKFQPKFKEKTNWRDLYELD